MVEGRARAALVFDDEVARASAGPAELLRADEHDHTDEMLGLTTPLPRNHTNPFGRHHFDLGNL